MPISGVSDSSRRTAGDDPTTTMDRKHVNLKYFVHLLVHTLFFHHVALRSTRGVHECDTEIIPFHHHLLLGARFLFSAFQLQLPRYTLQM